MSETLGRIPTPDPGEDARRRAAARTRDGEGLLFVALLFGQLMLALGLGAWAASGWDAAGNLTGYAAVGMLLVLLGAHALGYGALLLFGSVALLAMLPRLFRRRPAAPPAAAPRAALDRGSTAMAWLLAALHGTVLMAGALLLCLVLSLGSEAAGIGAWWRFALAALVLSAVTVRLLLAWMRAETL